MEETEFAVPKQCDLNKAEQLIEEVCAALGLQVAMKASLSTYPGSIHWHYKKGLKERGTLELTLFMSKRRIWAQVQSGRRAPWIEDVLPEVKQGVEKRLKQAGR